MHLKLIPPRQIKAMDCLREAFCLTGVGSVLIQQILEQTDGTDAPEKRLYVPSQWNDRVDNSVAPVERFDSGMLSVNSLSGAMREGLLISNARLICRYDREKLKGLLNSSSDSAVVAVEITQELAAPNELISVTPQNHLVGYRRILNDMEEPAAELEADFPAFLYFPPATLRCFGPGGSIPLEFEALRRTLNEQGVSMRLFRLGGCVYDLDTPQGLLFLLRQMPADRLHRVSAAAKIAPSARLIGPVWLGDNVEIDEQAVVTGPCILGDGVHIGPEAVVQNSIIAPRVTVKAGDCLRNALYLSDNVKRQETSFLPALADDGKGPRPHRDWPRFSYPRFGKRIFDLVFSSCILLLISPLLVVVTLMLKLTSPGPIFYRARRQGRQGKDFDCLKFRTMMVQADSLQERLRGINQVDGPQFKIDNDPRITGVGKFLRDTCIDELPQFFNVLLGQMSVVGPRPSPEHENEACPAWRDARLSVRPGITGLWQICRTRQAEMDFQEWIYYDTHYVRNLSFRQDLSICLRTASKLINTFLDQFG